MSESFAYLNAYLVALIQIYIIFYPDMLLKRAKIQWRC